MLFCLRFFCSSTFVGAMAYQEKQVNLGLWIWHCQLFYLCRRHVICNKEKQVKLELWTENGAVNCFIGSSVLGDFCPICMLSIYRLFANYIYRHFKLSSLAGSLISSMKNMLPIQVICLDIRCICFVLDMRSSRKFCCKWKYIQPVSGPELYLTWLVCQFTGDVAIVSSRDEW